MDRKLLTAEKILWNAEVLLKHVEIGKEIMIITYPQIRQEADPLMLPDLKKLYELYKGILYTSLNKPQDAQDAFLECVQNCDDPRIKKEGLVRLRELLQQRGLPTTQTSVLIDQFLQHSKDIIFLVND